MENQTQAKLTPINDAATFATLQVGERLVHCDGYTDDDYANLYWATVSKLTAKTVTLNSPDEGSWSYRTPAFRLRARWAGRPLSVEPQGDDSRGSPIDGDDQKPRRCQVENLEPTAAARPRHR